MEEQIPFFINDTFGAAWWTPMTTYNGNTYVAFTSPVENLDRHFLNVAKKDSTGNWENHMVTENHYEDDYGHNQTAICVDGSGRIHVITSMHRNSWKGNGGHYYRSTSPEDITEFANYSSTLPGQDSNLRYTYPIMRRHTSGDIYLIARRHDMAGAAPMVLYRWNNTAATWSSVAVVTSSAGDNLYIYPDDMQITDDGIIHIVWAGQADEASARRHLGQYINYNPSTGNWKTADGVTRTVPILYTATNLVYKGLVTGETTSTDDPGPGHQSASLSMALGPPSIMYRFRDTTSGINKVYRARWSTGFSEWVNELIYDASETSAAITHEISNGNIDCYFCAADGSGDYHIQRYRRVIATDVTSITQVSGTVLSCLYQEGNLIYANDPEALHQFLIQV